ncbi:hypothetical protein Goarm_000061, partial [Gossypium armourianum]|nr:hypothetical protein [Gossypium armourianum]
CTITLEDVALQLSLIVDRPVITRFAIVPSKVNLCQSLLGKVPDKFKVRETKLGICHIVHVESRDVSSHATKCDVDQWLSTPIVIVGLVATTISMSQGDRPIYVPVGDEMWDVKVLLIVYVTVEMHETEQMLWQFRMQSITVCEQFFSADTTIVDDYLAWFRVVVKSHLLSLEGRSRQIWAKRSQGPPQHTRRGRDHTMGSSSVSAENALPVAAQYLGHFGP